MKVIAEPENARSRRTRTAVLDAARVIIENSGFEALTMAAVAEHAGITRRAVYLHFASRAELVTAMFDQVSAAEGLAGSIRKVWEAPDAAAALDEWAAHLARFHPRILAIDLAAEQMKRTDADAAAHRQAVMADQRSACLRLADWLERDHRLAAPWTIETAADMLWALMSSGMIKALIVDRRWPPKRYARHLALLLRSTFLHGSGPTNTNESPTA